MRLDSGDGPGGGGDLKRAEIDLGAIAHNVRHVRGRLPSGSGVIAVVKANGYGHGAAPVAAAALEAGAWGLAVTTLEEAAELVHLCVPERILVLGGLCPDQATDAVALGCALTCSSLEMARALDAEASGRQPVHLKVDTGLGRLGCEPGLAPELARAIAGSRHLRLAGTFTHFASAGADEVFTRAQFARFMAVLGELGVDPGLRHACNSAAALAHPEMGLDAVRLGIGLYGCQEPGLRPALALRARIVDLRRIGKGDSVGYGRTWTASDLTLVANVSVGYADGVHRARSNRGWTLVRSRRAPVIGRISMDSLAIDVTEVPEVRVGDTVTLIGRDGEEITADMIGEWSETISYEVLTSIGPRVTRRYT